MMTRICAFNLVVGFLAASSPTAVAQQPYPDLKGTWIGPGQSVTQGKMGHWPNTGETGPVFREGSWTLIVTRQEGNRFTGSHGLTEGTGHDPILGVIRADQKTIHMVDDDGTFLTILTGPNTMEMCRTEVTAASRVVGCRQLTRQR
ncbi:hypothetical protein [Microvirga massiliensis]|uniref:hypothetical protein n=1 Tax=Microvirga massiliensis TaxID=1033741 RepID=UPI0006613E67|nr:hypothetical protein [Microvirga massiliensis]